MSLVVLLPLALAGIGIAYLALAGISLVRLARRSVPVLGNAPPITVLKPLHGAEGGLAANLESVLQQDYPAPVQYIFGVQSVADPAIDIVRDLQARHLDRDITLVVDARQHGTNRKVSNLINMQAHARNEVIVLADSDIRVGPDYLGRLACFLSESGVGAVTCPYHGIPGDGVFARLVGLGIDTHFLPGVAVGAALGIGQPCMGSTIALRQEVLDRIGAFQAVADDLADDHVLGERVRELGLRVALAPFTLGHVCPSESFGSLLHQELRWLRTIRLIEPVGHVASVIAHPLPFALAAFVLAPGLVTMGAVAASLSARILLCLAAERAFALNRHAYWLVPVRDLLSFALLVVSFFGRDVSWRGYRYEVARSGALLSKATMPNTRPDPT